MATAARLDSRRPAGWAPGAAMTRQAPSVGASSSTPGNSVSLAMKTMLAAINASPRLDAAPAQRAGTATPTSSAPASSSQKVNQGR